MTNTAAAQANNFTGALETFQAQFTREWDSKTSPSRLYKLSQIAVAIYEPDFNEVTGKTALYSAFPSTSVELLKHFLHSPEHQDLRERMANEVVYLKKQEDVSTILVAITHLAWTFMDYFELGRNGPLEVFAHVAMNKDKSEFSGIEIMVNLPRRKKDIRPSLPPANLARAEKALSWVLNAFLYYAGDLDLTGSREQRRNDFK